MTLVEAVAGLALLGLLLVAILLAKARYTRQWARANLRGQAVAAADALLGQWRQAAFPMKDESGYVDGTDFAWRRNMVSDKSAAVMGLQVVRLEVFDDRPMQREPVSVTVDFVMPIQGQKP